MSQQRRATESVAVICSRCGREMLGDPNVYGKFVIRKHRRPDGFACLGHLYTGHRVKAASQ